MNYNTAVANAKKIIANKRNTAIEKANALNDFAMENDLYKASILQHKELISQIAFAEYKNTDTKALNEKLSLCEKKIQQALKTMGIDAENLKPSYNCKKCSDTGFVNGKKCQCLKQEIVKQLGQDSNIYNSSASFANAKPTEFISLCQKWCDKFPNAAKRNMLLFGGTGVGKTYLTHCIFKDLLDKGFVVNYTTAFALNEKFLQIHTDFSHNRQQLWFDLLECDLLIIDDLGTEPVYNNITIEYLFNLVNERLISNKSLIISTNLDLERIFKHYGERLFSRICDKAATHLLKIENEDLRLNK